MTNVLIEKISKKVRDCFSELFSEIEAYQEERKNLEIFLDNLKKTKLIKDQGKLNDLIRENTLMHDIYESVENYKLKKASLEVTLSIIETLTKSKALLVEKLDIIFNFDTIKEDFTDFLDKYENSVNDRTILNQLYQDLHNYKFLFDENKIIKDFLEDYDNFTSAIETTLISIDGYSSKKKDAEEFIVKLQNIGIENITRELKKLRELGDQTKLKNYFNKLKKQFSVLQRQGNFFNNFLDTITDEKVKVKKEDKRYDKIASLLLDVFDTKEDKLSYNNILKNVYGLKEEIKAKLEKIDQDNFDIVFIKTKYNDLKEKIAYTGMLYERLREIEAQTSVLKKQFNKFRGIKQKLENYKLAVLRLGGYRDNNFLDSLNRFYVYFKDEQSKRALGEIKPIIRETVEEEVKSLKFAHPTNKVAIEKYIARFERYTNKLAIVKNYNLISTLEEGLFFLYEISDPAAHDRAEVLQKYIRERPDLIERKPLNVLRMVVNIRGKAGIARETLEKIFESFFREARQHIKEKRPYAALFIYLEAIHIIDYFALLYDFEAIRQKIMYTILTRLGSLRRKSKFDFDFLEFLDTN